MTRNWAALVILEREAILPISEVMNFLWRYRAGESFSKKIVSTKNDTVNGNRTDEVDGVVWFPDSCQTIVTLVE